MSDDTVHFSQKWALLNIESQRPEPDVVCTCISLECGGKNVTVTVASDISALVQTHLGALLAAGDFMKKQLDAHVVHTPPSSETIQ